MITIPHDNGVHQSLESAAVLKYLFSLVWCSFALVLALPSAAQTAAQSANGDALILEMASAFKRDDQRRLTQLLPQVRGHLLEPWAAYWELRARLAQASEAEIRQFLTRYANTYQEDRLRNDWLLLLGSRRDWSALAAEHTKFRMRDDREVQCYVGLIDFLRQEIGRAHV